MRAISYLIIGLFLLQAAFAYEMRTYSAEYDLSSDSAVVSIVIEFASNVTRLELPIPADTQDIFVLGANFSILDRADYPALLATGRFDTLQVTYSTKSVIEEDESSLFILDASDVPSEKKSILVSLPAGATLRYALDSGKSSMIPKTKDVLTDGKRIIIRWNEAILSDDAAILVMYENPRSPAWLYVVGTGMFLLAAFIIAAVYFWPRPADIHAEKDITRNLLDDERKIVEIVAREKEGVWQKQVQLKSGLNKVQVSRKVRALEAKGILEKVPYGNTNKLRIKRA